MHIYRLGDYEPTYSSGVQKKCMTGQWAIATWSCTLKWMRWWFGSDENKAVSDMVWKERWAPRCRIIIIELFVTPRMFLSFANIRVDTSLFVTDRISHWFLFILQISLWRWSYKSGKKHWYSQSCVIYCCSFCISSLLKGRTVQGHV